MCTLYVLYKLFSTFIVSVMTSESFNFKLYLDILTLGFMNLINITLPIINTLEYE